MRASISRRDLLLRCDSKTCDSRLQLSSDHLAVFRPPRKAQSTTRISKAGSHSQYHKSNPRPPQWQSGNESPATMIYHLFSLRRQHSSHSNGSAPQKKQAAFSPQGRRDFPMHTRAVLANKKTRKTRGEIGATITFITMLITLPTRRLNFYLH